MVKEDTADFLRLMNEQNARIAARQAKENAGVGLDPIRLQREQERRKRWGTLRAIERPGKRPQRARSVFGHIDVT